MEISLTNEQRQVLGEQMLLSMKLLQMSAAELDDYLRELSLENPLLEASPPEERSERHLSEVRSAVTRSKTGEASLDETEYLRSASIYDSLAGSVREQINTARVPELMRSQLLWLAGELDERGYLPEDAGDLRVFGGSRQMYDNAVTVLQSFEPAGVGARSLSECLRIQLRRLGAEDGLTDRLCGTEYLERLARGQFNALSKELGVPVARLAQAKELISTLEPRPSNGFSDGEAVPYIVPDVEVVADGAQFIVRTADRYMPSYRVDGYYARMAADESLTAEEREYFTAKLAQAKWAVGCVDRRREMLTECAKALVSIQRDFFTDGKSALRPATMTELADSLGVHPSTVSRAVSGKYLRCKWGVFPLSRFFARELGPEGGTGGELLDAIKEIIAGEDVRSPLSDRAIAEKLASRGLVVSRRTVAKYRDEACIPSAPARRERQV